MCILKGLFISSLSVDILLFDSYTEYYRYTGSIISVWEKLMQIFSLHIFFLSHILSKANYAVKITLSTVGSLQALGLNGGHWRWLLSKLNCFTPLRVKKIDSKGPFFVREW